MDESSPLAEPRPEQTNSAVSTPRDASIGDAKPAAPRSTSRTITSKRVVIPASAKKSARVPPAPVAAPVADTLTTPIEPAPLAKGETPDNVYTPPPPYAPASTAEAGPEPITPKASTTPPASGIQSGDIPFAPTPAGSTPLTVAEPPRKRRTVKWLLWLGAALLLIIAALAILPLLFPR